MNKNQHLGIQDYSCCFMLTEIKTKRALGGVDVPTTKLFSRLAVNKTILKPHVAAATGTQYLYVGFSPM